MMNNYSILFNKIITGGESWNFGYVSNETTMTAEFILYSTKSYLRTHLFTQMTLCKNQVQVYY